jgi:diacylglycerol kinase (ATP)
MVCCALIASLLGMLTLFFKPLMRKRSAMQWRLASTNGVAAGANYTPQAISKFNVTARFRSFGFAFDGLRFVFIKEHNMRIHTAAAIGAIAAGLYYHITVDEWRWIILAVILVIATEIINTAIEQTCNALGGKYDEHIRNAKDIAAAAVLLCAATALVIGASVFIPHLSTAYDGLSEVPSFSRICGPIS